MKLERRVVSLGLALALAGSGSAVLAACAPSANTEQESNKEAQEIKERLTLGNKHNAEYNFELVNETGLDFVSFTMFGQSNKELFNTNQMSWKSGDAAQLFLPKLEGEDKIDARLRDSYTLVFKDSHGKEYTLHNLVAVNIQSAVLKLDETSGIMYVEYTTKEGQTESTLNLEKEIVEQQKREEAQAHKAAEAPAPAASEAPAQQSEIVPAPAASTSYEAAADNSAQADNSVGQQEDKCVPNIKLRQ